MVAGVRKGAWSEEEDSLLRKCIEKYGEGKWHQVPLRAGLNRCRKSCRLRWLNYLQPNIKRGVFSLDETDLIVRLHKLLGNRWSLIAGRLPGRTGNDVKNYWNTHHAKKSQSKPTKTPSTTTKKVKVFKPRPRIFMRHNITTFPSRVDKSTPIIPKNSKGIISENSAMKFGGLFDGKEVGASSLFQLSGKEEEAMNRFWCEEIPTFLSSNDELGDGDSNNKGKHETIIWDSDVSEFVIDGIDIWGLLNYAQETI